MIPIVMIRFFILLVLQSSIAKAAVVCRSAVVGRHVQLSWVALAVILLRVLVAIHCWHVSNTVSIDLLGASHLIWDVDGGGWHEAEVLVCIVICKSLMGLDIRIVALSILFIHEIILRLLLELVSISGG